MGYKAGEVASFVGSANSVIETAIVSAGFEQCVVFPAIVLSIPNPSASPTTSPTLLPSTIIATADSKTEGTNGAPGISDDNYVSNNNLRFHQ
jgi:hypothetical protein